MPSITNLMGLGLPGPLATEIATGSLTLTDGTHSIANTTQVTITGGTVGGTSPNATLTIAGGSGGTTTATIGLTAAQLYALADTPPVLVAAPGAGKAIIVSDGVMTYKFGTQPYDSTGGGAVEVGYVGYAPTNSADINLGITASQIVAPINLNFTATSFSNLANLGITLRQVNGNYNLNAGSIVSSSKAAGGSGYAPGDTGLIFVDDQDATYTVNTVGAGGSVLTYTITDPGSGYYVRSAAATQVSTGSGNGAFTVNILSVVLGDGTLSITLTYRTVTL